MSKKDLRKYISELSKEQLEYQILDLYERFKNVKEFYDFAFNPNEAKLLQECKVAIAKEYFPPSGRKPKARRSVAQKHIKKFRQLGVDPLITADLMLYNIEIAQTFSSERIVKAESFFVSMLKSFEEAVAYIFAHSLIAEYRNRIEGIVTQAEDQYWFNKDSFAKILLSNRI